MALKDLAEQLAEVRRTGEEVGDCYAVRINRGNFGVQWQKTKAVMEAGDLDITVFKPEEEEKADAAAGKRLVQPSVMSGGVEGSTSSEAARAEAETTLDEHNVGVKRKRDADVDGDDGRAGENVKGKKFVPTNRSITKRNMLGLDR